MPLVAAAGCGHDRTARHQTGWRGKQRLTLLQVDRHGAIAFDSANRRLIGFDRVDRRLSEAWSRELDPALLLDVACAMQCPRVALLVSDTATARGSRVEFMDGSGRRRDIRSSGFDEQGVLLHIYRWRKSSALFLRSHRSALELVARYGRHEIVVPVQSAAVVVKANAAGNAVVIADRETVTVLSTGNGGAWEIVRRIRTAAKAVCIAPAGDQVLIAADADILEALPSGRLHRMPSVLPRVGACAIAQNWTVKGVLQSVNGAPSSEWVAQRRDGRVLWRHSYPTLADVLVSASGDVACVAFDVPACFTPRGDAVARVTGPVAADEDGTLVYLDDDGRLTAVVAPAG
jgi:hypothetical protein